MRRALGFLTVFGGASTPSGTTLAWFPLAGALIGAVLGAAWWGAARLWTPLVAAAMVVAADAAVTGLLHLDGLADTADGLLAPMDRSRRLVVMADPHVGAFGMATVAVVLVLRVVALGSVTAAPLLLAGVWCASRTTMAVIAWTQPYARPGGLADAFLSGGRASGRATAVVGLGGAVLAIGLVSVGGGQLTHRWMGALAVVVGAVVAAGVAGLARRRLGGFTGDVLGAAGVAGETAALLVLAVRR
jgi:adenosylcobinamide-GDP ribazoletransferase